MRKKWVWALCLGALAGVFHYLYIRALESGAGGGDDVRILVSSKKVGVGETLLKSDIARRLVPGAFVDDRVVLEERLGEVIGMKAAVDLDPGFAIQWTDFVHRDDPMDRDLARLVESGQRAMAIPVDGSLSLGGMLRPGHRVDVIGTFSRGKQRGEKVTVTLLQNVTVLATGSELGGEVDDEQKPARYSTVTMSVGIEEGELLAFASKQGTLSLVLRGYQDLTVVDDVPEKDMNDVWEAEKRNALQSRPRGGEGAIERIGAR